MTKEQIEQEIAELEPVAKRLWEEYKVVEAETQKAEKAARNAWHKPWERLNSLKTALKLIGEERVEPVDPGAVENATRMAVESALMNTAAEIADKLNEIEVTNLYGLVNDATDAATSSATCAATDGAALGGRND